MTLDVGIHPHIPQADYLRDPCPQPSLSSSLARLMVGYSPLHAWTASPRLNPDYLSEDRAEFDLGTAAHALILEGIEHHPFQVVNAPDWKSKAARDSRDEIRAAGKTPLLAEQWERVRAMAYAAKMQLDAFDGLPRPFSNGQPEETLIWQEEGVWCRARLDWLHADARVADDLKTTSGSANPAVWSRSLWSSGYDIQAAFYLRGIKAVLGADAEFRFVVLEARPPYALSVVALDPQGLALADRKVSRAIRDWRECLATGHWPGYPTSVCYADVPPWEAAKWEAREYHDREPVAVDDGRDIAQQLFGDRT